MRMHTVLGMAAVLLAILPLHAQMLTRPTDPPRASAAGESWYQLREPMAFAGDTYFRAGAAVFFDGNVMVRTGHYNGIPLYADTTLEPYSLVYVPMGGGLLQPYERRRRGDLAGTVGSRPPSFPIERRSDGGWPPATATAPTGLPVTVGAVSAFTPETSMPGAPSAPVRAVPQPTALSTATTTPAAPVRLAIASVIAPRTNDGVWVNYAGGRWVSGGRAVPREADMAEVGNHQGFPVLRRQGAGIDVIYLPVREGAVAPYRRKL